VSAQKPRVYLKEDSNAKSNQLDIFCLVFILRGQFESRLEFAEDRGFYVAHDHFN